MTQERQHNLIAVGDIEQLLRSVFPDFYDWNPTDEEYRVVRWVEMPGLIKRFPASKWQENKWECEEIAKAFVTDVRREEAADPVITHNRAIGVCNCEKLHGEEIGHTINILITDKGVVLLDMQTETFWLAESGQDAIYFVEM